MEFYFFEGIIPAATRAPSFVTEIGDPKVETPCFYEFYHIISKRTRVLSRKKIKPFGSVCFNGFESGFVPFVDLSGESGRDLNDAGTREKSARDLR